MKKGLFIFVLLLSLCFLSNHSYAADDWTGNVNLAYGIKSLDKDDWSIEGLMSLDKQTEVGFNADFGKKSWPVHIVIGYTSSSADDSITVIDQDYNIPVNLKFEGSTTELRLGVNKIWEPTPIIRPYIGGGLAIIGAKAKLIGAIKSMNFEMTIANDSDHAVGYWLNSGAYITLSSHYNLGIEVGYSKATVKLADVDGEAGGTHAALFVGYHW